MSEEKWWRDPQLLQAEVAKHGGNRAAAARSNGLSPRVLSNAWADLGLPSLGTGGVPAVPTDIGSVVSEEEILRQRVSELEHDYAQRRKQDVFEARLVRAVEQACEAKKPSYRPAPKRKASSKDAHEFVLLWSDTHAAEVVSLEETNGLNEYNWEIMLRRQEKLTESVVSFAEHRGYPIRALHVLGLGDHLSGNIHDELSETNEFPLAEATVQAGLDFAEWLEGFVPYFPLVRFAGVVGNHPRAHHKPRAKQKFDNADWTMFQIMRQRLSRTNIEFEIPKAQKWPVQVCNRRLLMWHGDGVRSTMPGVPWGGVMRRVSTMANEYAAAGIPIDHFVNGHFHAFAAVDGGRVVMNGSVKGVDEYSLHAFGGGQSPKQTLLTFHPTNGLTDISVIDL